MKCPYYRIKAVVAIVITAIEYGRMKCPYYIVGRLTKGLKL